MPRCLVGVFIVAHCTRDRSDLERTSQGRGIAAVTLALLVMVVYLNPWLIVGIAISTAIFVAGLQTLHEASP